MTTILDENRIPVALGVSMADGLSVEPVHANPTEKSLCCDVMNTGIASSGDDKRDENRKVAFMAVSAVDGVTPVAVYVNPTTNALLIKTN